MDTSYACLKSRECEDERGGRRLTLTWSEATNTRTFISYLGPSYVFSVCYIVFVANYVNGEINVNVTCCPVYHLCYGAYLPPPLPLPPSSRRPAVLLILITYKQS